MFLNLKDVIHKMLLIQPLLVDCPCFKVEGALGVCKCSFTQTRKARHCECWVPPWQLSLRMCSANHHDIWKCCFLAFTWTDISKEWFLLDTNQTYCLKTTQKLKSIGWVTLAYIYSYPYLLTDWTDADIKLLINLLHLLKCAILY